ncbi:hypothetical protein HNQ56_001171 [Anaerotaenia torta]|uniref:hypothetical protein n=1 Tax=Anaerotaenia torta TaxID=433293 RepID=UPI003D240C9B
MKLIDLSGQWRTELDDGKSYTAILPGTLDENRIGYKDRNPNQWKSAEGNAADMEKASPDGPEVITTRLTRVYSYEGAAVFSREILVEEECQEEGCQGECREKRYKEKRCFLEAERTRELTLRLNGKIVEPCVPGTVSTPYIFELTDFLTDKSGSLSLVCDNSYPSWPRDAILYSSAATDETQTNWNGILGYLRLRMEKEVFLSDIRVYPKSGYITVAVEMDAAMPYEGSLSLKSAALENDAERRVSLEAGIHSIIFENLPLREDCKRWDEFEGSLYELAVSAQGLDSRKVFFGIRDFSDNGKGRLALNGRNIFLRSEANCCVFPEAGHMPLTVEEWTEVLNTYKSYGVNCLRFHSHCPPDAAFTAADRMGMLMQPELSHWNPRTAFEDENSWKYYRTELVQILRFYANHPSFVMLTFGNELTAGELGHRRMEELLALARNMDPTRMYANGSNNHYGAVGAKGSNDFYTSSNFYDKMIRGTSSPMIGHINEAYPNTGTNYDSGMEEIRKEYAGPVFSFEVGQYEVLPDFDEIEEFNGVTLPDNLRFIRKRVEERGFLADWKKRVEATGELALLAYREEIEAAMRTREFSGISLLGLQDFPGQGTALVGMLNSHLRPKPFDFAQPERFRQFFRPVLPLILLERYTYTNQEMLSAVIEIANYGKETILAPAIYELKDGEELLESGSLPAVTIPCGGITVIGGITLSLKDILSPKKLNLAVVIDRHRNEYPIWVYPEDRTWIKTGDVPACGTPDSRQMNEPNHSQGNGAANNQGNGSDNRQGNRTDNNQGDGSNNGQGNGPDKKQDIDFGEVIVTRNYSDTLEELAKGKRVFYSPAAEEEHFPSSVQSQFTTDFWSVGTFANQSGCMGCLIESSHPVFTGFPTEGHSNWQWWPMSNGRAMIIPGEIQPIVTVMDCYARLRRMAFLLECNAGKGKLMISSMGLLEKQEYPEVRALTKSIIRYMNSQEFVPGQELSLEMLGKLIR